jgi:hypothetical protein
VDCSCATLLRVRGGLGGRATIIDNQEQTRRDVNCQHPAWGTCDAIDRDWCSVGAQRSVVPSLAFTVPATADHHDQVDTIAFLIPVLCATSGIRAGTRVRGLGETNKRLETLNEAWRSLICVGRRYLGTRSGRKENDGES